MMHLDYSHIPERIVVNDELARTIADLGFGGLANRLRGTEADWQKDICAQMPDELADMLRTTIWLQHQP